MAADAVLAAGDDTAAFDLRWGGRLASLVLGGAERILTEAPDAAHPAPRELLWGSYLMAPWAGRVAGAEIAWHGRTLALRRNLQDNSIHGLVYDRPVAVESCEAAELVTTCELPWELGGSVRQRARLDPGRLTLTAELRAGEEGMPAWAGWHPLFRRPAAGDVAITLDAAEIVEVSSENLPTGRTVPAQGDQLLVGEPLGGRRLDFAYAGARPPAVIAWPDLELTMTWEPPIETVVVYTPDFCFCVEPQSGWPDAARFAATAPTGFTDLGPGETLTLTTTWSWGRR